MCCYNVSHVSTIDLIYETGYINHFGLERMQSNYQENKSLELH